MALVHYHHHHCHDWAWPWLDYCWDWDPCYHHHWHYTPLWRPCSTVIHLPSSHFADLDTLHDSPKISKDGKSVALKLHLPSYVDADKLK